jgi:hypothetical protein
MYHQVELFGQKSSISVSVDLGVVEGWGQGVCPSHFGAVNRRRAGRLRYEP